MPIETQCSLVAQQMCNLVGCDAAYVFLGCQEPALRHPLLDLLFAAGHDAVAYAGLPSELDLCANEQVRALSDLAIQTGCLQSIASCSIITASTHIQSMAIVPLERPAGVMGCLLLTDAHPGAFYYGEQLLLRQYVPRVTHELERTLRGLCAVPFHPIFRGGAEKPSRRDSCLNVHIPPEARGAASMPENAQLERQRQELERLKHEFIAMVSHELRTPLTAIKGYAVLLQAYGITGDLQEGARGCSGGEMTLSRQREYLDIIMEQTSHLEVLISDLLDVSRIHADRLALRCQGVDLAALCQRIVQLIQQRVDQQYPERFTLECRLAPDLPLTWSDPDRVQQVLTNLLENAVKYSPDGGPIEVIVAPRPPLLEAYAVCSPDAVPAPQVGASLQEPLMVYVTVRDQGIGIPPNQHAQLFKPFSRLEHPRAGDVPGAGLGLYLTQKLVEAMQGSVALSSRAGAGTSVTFSLPVMLPMRDSSSSTRQVAV